MHSLYGILSIALVIMLCFESVAFAAGMSPKKRAASPPPAAASQEAPNQELPTDAPLPATPPQPSQNPPAVGQQAPSAQPAPPGETAPQTPPPPRQISLNFESADIGTVIAALAEELKINYILSPNVTGKVTIHSYRRFSSADLFPLFQTILDVNGLTAVRDNGLYRIMPVDIAKQHTPELRVGRDTASTDASFVTQIIPLEFIKGSEAAALLKNLLPKGTDVIVYEPANMLIITSSPSAIAKVIKLIDTVDQTVKDREAVRTHVYYVENGDAKKLAELLKNLYQSDRKGSAPRPAAAPLQPAAQPGGARPAATTTTTTLSGADLTVEIDGDIVITPYEDINALLIKASPRGYFGILETLKKLDIANRQVLIEVMIAEVTLNDSTQFGIEWMLRGRANDSNFAAGFGKSLGQDEKPKFTVDGALSTIALNSYPASGLFAAAIRPDRYGAMLTAFAGLGKLNVIASPHILAMDNKEAKIEIGDEIPIATGFLQQPATAASGSNAFVAAGQIQYRTTGVLLTVTPQISEKNMVRLKISQEISTAGSSISVGGTDSPTFTKRKAETIGAVQSGHTLVIGGLISEQKNVTKDGLPILSRIPILGSLFGVTKDETKKTELIVLVTPHVVRSTEEADALTERFQNRVKIVKERIEQSKSKE